MTSAERRQAENLELNDENSISPEEKETIKAWATLFAATVKLAKKEQAPADELGYLEKEFIANDGLSVLVRVKPYISRGISNPELITINLYDVEIDEFGEKIPGLHINEWIGNVKWENDLPVNPWVDYADIGNSPREFMADEVAKYGIAIIKAVLGEVEQKNNNLFVFNSPPGFSTKIN